ncbi:MAG: putative Membrane protein-like [Aeromicrobium sp.]|nr:putative Membrane protein-like [Aeromicrobium sp.]
MSGRPGSLRELWDRSGEAMARHPRVPMAAKAAVAAAVAWLAVLPFGGIADDYAYYAPLGAVIAVSATVAKSWQVSWQSIGGIILGAALAFAAARLPIASVLELAVVVGGGIILAGWTRLGQGGEWVPLAGLFVLIIGSAERVGFVVAYVGLTSLGALIGMAFNLLWPPLPLVWADGALARLRATLADQLDALAGGLSHSRAPTLQEWQQFRRDVGPRTSEMREMAAQADEARLVNWRAMRWRETSDHQSRSARDLDRLALVVEDLTALVVDSEHADREVLALGPDLRRPSATAMRSTAALVRQADDTPMEQLVAAVDADVQALVAAVIDVGRRTGDDVFAAGAVITSLRQVRQVVESSRWRAVGTDRR